MRQRSRSTAGAAPVPFGLDMSRRTFVQGLMGGGLALALPAARGDTPAPPREGVRLRGNVFRLVVDTMPVNFTGRLRLATVVNGALPAPTLVWREGETVTIEVVNRLPTTTALHWHGILLPYDMDGVPGVSFNGIAPGATHIYRFQVRQTGTYWYHAHAGFQEMEGLYGAIIIEPREARPRTEPRDAVVMLSEWTDADPARVFAKLQAESHLYNFNQPTVGDFWRDLRAGGLSGALSRRRMFATMRMNPTDLSDVSTAVMTYLVNGTTVTDNWTQLFTPGEPLRLRVINAAGNTFFDVRIPGLPMTVVEADGIEVEPITVDEFRIAPGETYDVMVTPVDDAYTIFAESMERSGFAAATLAVRPGLRAPLPSRRPAQWLTMVDMMGMAHNAPGSTSEPDPHAGHGGHDAHAGHGAATTTPAMSLVRHAPEEWGPTVDMRVDTPRTNLDDPGVGLRDAPHRVLTAAQLRHRHPLPDPRQPQRDIELHLTGNMERYSWSFDGREARDALPVPFRLGERLRVILHNDTMMTHPMHLHGMWSDLEDVDGTVLTRRHIITVQPAQRLSFAVTADAPGRWAWHCHLLYHMNAGMFREVVVA